jgi:putative ABC transport system permease protein
MNDLHFAIRQLRKNPGFTAAAVLTLALGIGANTAIFSVFKALVLDPLPYPDPLRLVHVWKSDIAIRDYMPLSGPDYFDLRAQNQCFEELGAYTTARHNLGGDKPVRVQGILCTAAILRAFGVQPALGRWFTETEETEGTRRVVVLSYRLWQERYAGDPALVGRTIRAHGSGTTTGNRAPRLGHAVVQCPDHEARLRRVHRASQVYHTADRVVHGDRARAVATLRKCPHVDSLKMSPFKG